MNFPERIPSKLLKRAIPVGGEGSDDLGWSTGDALEVIDALRGTKIAILGGDLCRSEQWGVTPGYENWSCGVLPGETATEFAQRTQEVARARVESHADDASGSLLFVLTFSGQDDAA